LQASQVVDFKERVDPVFADNAEVSIAFTFWEYIGKGNVKLVCSWFTVQFGFGLLGSVRIDGMAFFIF
jgi:hypothetical protein